MDTTINFSMFELDETYNAVYDKFVDVRRQHDDLAKILGTDEVQLEQMRMIVLNPLKSVLIKILVARGQKLPEFLK